MTRRTGTLLVTSLLVAALLVVGVWLPVPYVVQDPGPVANTLADVAGKPLITVNGAPTYPTSGRLDLVTVEERNQLKLFGALSAWLSRSSAVLPEEVEKTPGVSEADLQREYQQQMAESQKSAVSAALHELAIPATVTVAGLSEASPSTGKLRTGDVVTAIDGRPIRDAIDLRSDVGDTPAGSNVVVGYRRGNAAPATVTITPQRQVQDGKARALIGIYSDEKRAVTVNLQMVSINGQSVGGPSAGMMFALGIVDVLTPGSLTAGKTIAGTGTIDPDGVVGPIGGIQQKLIGARRDGARVFLTPADNCEEARGAIPKGLRLVRVSTLDDAVKALQSIAVGRTDQAGC